MNDISIDWKESVGKGWLELSDLLGLAGAAWVWLAGIGWLTAAEMLM